MEVEGDGNGIYRWQQWRTEEGGEQGGGAMMDGIFGEKGHGQWWSQAKGSDGDGGEANNDEDGKKAGWWQAWWHLENG